MATPAYLDFLNQLIRNGAESSKPERVDVSMDIVAKYLRDKGVRQLTFEEYRGHRYLFAANHDGKVSEVLFIVHLDVVPPVSPSQFEPKLEGEWLYGRGSCDDLGNAMVATETLIALKDSPLTIGILFSGDEEIGGFTTKEMVERGYIASKLSIVPDSSPYCIVSREKGLINLKATVSSGHACHASRPWQGVNAADILLADYAELRKQLQNRPQATPEDPWHDTFTMCQIHSGKATNQVPGTAELTLNIRYTNGAERDSIHQLIRNAMSHSEISVIDECLPVLVDENNPIICKLLQTMKQHFPEKEIGFGIMCGATDARHLPQGGPPILIIGVEGREAHGPAECVNLTSIDNYIQWLTQSLPATLL